MHSLPAITTKYLGPTYTRGGRIKATGPHELNSDDAHRKAAESLAVSMGWNPATRDSYGSPA